MKILKGDSMTTTTTTTQRISSPNFLVVLMLLMVLCTSVSILWSFGFFTSLASSTTLSSSSPSRMYSQDFDPNMMMPIASRLPSSTSSTTPSSPSKFKRNIIGGRPPPLIARRTMYTAGYDARVFVKPSTNPYISWQWTAKTERYIDNLYNSVMNPTSCSRDTQNQGQHTIRLLKQPWGLGSRIRDTVDIMLAALDVNRTVLHAGTTTQCPFLTPNGQVIMNININNNELQDPYMNCLYQTFSKCQGVSPVNQLVNVRRAWGLFNEVPGGTLVERRRYTQRDIDQAVHRWWKELLHHGLHAVQYTTESSTGITTTTTTTTISESSSMQQQPLLSSRTLTKPPMASLDDKYSVIRALMARQVFSPSKVTPWVQQRVVELEQQANLVGSSSLSSSTTTSVFQSPTLVVHLRRTDKVRDEAPLYPHEQRPSIPETLVVIRALMRAAQRLSGMEFRSIFFMSDEPQAFRREHIEYLSSTLPQRPVVFFSDYVWKTLSNHSEYRDRGHEFFIDSIDHDIMDHELVATMTFAAKHGSYLVGYGRSGVSQLLAQLIGAKHRICPSQVSLFEDDMVLLQELEETRDWLWYIKGT
ncbi:hypothetical protein IV203_021351 [Nitzschia inconspicua]|uniref:O-fucosyltransferase family protein n=1 Tax=Nitzschia inconspicua TaxID=303405 RepID=A0A9K3PE61_9STRA|nr:hypothetical protein IV203_021351 [Nitzschia inconspicua]